MVSSLEELAVLVHRSTTNNSVLHASLDGKLPKRFLVAPR